jgi:hypothetical protein
LQLQSKDAAMMKTNNQTQAGLTASKTTVSVTLQADGKN